MDVALLFFLPLIGGFLFVERFYGTRFRAARQETQRLYYQAAAWGVLLSIVGLLLHRWLGAFAFYRLRADEIGLRVFGPLFERPATTGGPPSPESVAIRIDLAFACAWALVLGMLTPVVNGVVYLVDRIWYLGVARRLHRSSLIATINRASITDQFEILLAEALADSKQIQVTLSNQKVYVGWVTRSPNPWSQEKYFRIQPSISGFRSKDDGEVRFSTFYDELLDRYTNDPKRLRAYEIVIPMDKIVSASGFDPAAYVEFQKKRATRPADTPPIERHLTGDVTVYLGRPLRRP